MNIFCFFFIFFLFIILLFFSLISTNDIDLIFFLLFLHTATALLSYLYILKHCYMAGYTRKKKFIFQYRSMKFNLNSLLLNLFLCTDLESIAFPSYSGIFIFILFHLFLMSIFLFTRE